MTILCYGDSNTFGFDPRSFLGGRYAPDCRWVDILAAKTGWNVHNNSMNGQEIPKREVCFSISADLLILMLGTNDLLQGATAEETARRMGDFLGKLSIDSRKILLIAPPPLKRGEWVSDDQLVRESLALCSLYRHLAKALSQKQALLCRQLLQESQSQANCLKGICFLLTGAGEKLQQPDLRKEPAHRLLVKCYGREIRCLAEYEARTADPEYGPVFACLAARERQLCTALLELMGMLQG